MDRIAKKSGRQPGDLSHKNRNHTDLKKFCDRLCHLMKLSDMSVARLATAFMMEDGYREPYDDVSGRRFDAYKRTISIHLNKDDPEAIGSGYIIRYARALNCTTDYLLGLDDSPSPQTQTLKETIGIHPGACYRLENYGEPERLVLSNLIYPHVGLKKHATTDYLNNLLHAVYDYGVLASSKNTVLTCENDLLPGFNRSYAGDEAEAVLRYRATMAFERCLDAIRDSVDIRIAEGLAKFIKKSKENPGQFEENLRKEWEKEQEAKKPQRKKSNGIWKTSSRS